ncbi:T9SS type A sorting domain-containing protein [Flavobacterium caeni]|uniref:Por secretion system C-terminal sorting domain-containing protein n=1 Tax=Flavobacterium caeni TaxID=490189 RepID=A0A1G5JHJ5_9FLAO|nr:T9SS type A sorting domain-containing protein [Flavobacterium caeni]SCY87239.1 Por secretion system C-terminal sorting domain-containing protein [Flavobacterium caeni]
MKTKLLSILFALCGITGNAQLDPITDGNLDAGSIVPKFQYQGNLYALASSGGQYGFYKINPTTNDVTQIQLSGELGSFNYSVWQLITYCGTDCYMRSGGLSPNYYNNEVYLNNFAVDYDNLKLDTQNNTLTIDGLGRGYGHVFSHRLFYSSLYRFKDFTTGDVSWNDQPSNWFSGQLAYNVNDEMILPIDWVDSQTGNTYKRLTKVNTDFGTNFGVVDDIDLTSAEIQIIDSFSYLKKPIFVNNKLLYIAGYQEANPNRIISVDVSNFDYNNLNLLSFDSTTHQGFDYIVLNDGVIFLHRMYNSETGYSHKWYKTDGINTAVEINNMPDANTNAQDFYLNYWFKTYSDTNGFISPAYGNASGGVGNAFVTIGNTTYFSTIDREAIECKLWKMSSINSAPELIHTYNASYLDTRASIIFAAEWQGNLIFLNIEDGLIYRYDGTELIADPQLNNLNCEGCRMADQPQYSISGILPTETNIFIFTNLGVFSIQESLSTTETELIQLQVYPNPANETLFFSKELKNITIYDLMGRTIKSFTGTHEKIEISDLSAGNYILKAEAEKGGKFIEKFVKH